MKSIAFTMLFCAIALFAMYAAPAVTSQAQNPVQREVPGTPGRYVLSGEGSERLLLDTQEGVTWALRASTAYTDARLEAWIPIDRVDNEAQMEAWVTKATDKYNRFVAQLQQQAAQHVAKLEAELGAEHPDVVDLKKNLKEGYAPWTTAQMRKAIESP